MFQYYLDEITAYMRRFLWELEQEEIIQIQKTLKDLAALVEAVQQESLNKAHLRQAKQEVEDEELSEMNFFR